MSDRQIVLDTETTGLEHRRGHRIIEIGGVEMINRKLTGNNYQVYLNPERKVDQGAMEIHGIRDEFLQDKPLFADISQQLLEYLEGAELIIHNAPFDVGFLDMELTKLAGNQPQISEICTIYDTLLQARKMFPGQRNTLDALCTRFEINNSHRELHGALLDAEILADVYLAMTGGQTDLALEASSKIGDATNSKNANVDLAKLDLPTVQVSKTEAELHQQWLKKLDKAVDGECVWTRLNQKLKH